MTPTWEASKYGALEAFERTRLKNTMVSTDGKQIRIPNAKVAGRGQEEIPDYCDLGLACDCVNNGLLIR